MPDPERDAMVKKLAEATGAKKRAAEELASLKQNSSDVCQEVEKSMTVRNIVYKSTRSPDVLFLTVHEEKISVNHLIHVFLSCFAQVAQDAANRWTDNVFTIRSWLVDKFNVESNMLNKRFGIPEDFDYVD